MKRIACIFMTMVLLILVVPTTVFGDDSDIVFSIDTIDGNQEIYKIR